MKEFILEKLYKIIKYSKAIASISTIALVFLVIWAVLLSFGQNYLNENGVFLGLRHSPYYAPFVVFIVLFFACYLICILLTTALYVRHIKNGSELLRSRYELMTISTIICPFGLSFVLFMWTKQLINDINNDVIELDRFKEEPKPKRKHEH